MADVDVQVQYTTTERKTRKVKKTSKRRESTQNQDGEVTVTEIEQTNQTTTNDDGGEYAKAMNKDWHSGHFCCWQCDESLTGQRYVLRDEHPYCIKCYESVFANGCEECSKIIGIDSKDLSYKDKHWHEACFLCAKCRVSLVDKQFGSKLDKIYCGNCYDAQFASRCDGCGEVFRAGKCLYSYTSSSAPSWTRSTAATATTPSLRAAAMAAERCSVLVSAYIATQAVRLQAGQDLLRQLLRRPVCFSGCEWFTLRHKTVHYFIATQLASRCPVTVSALCG
ncbi:LIM domain-containing protein [Phthorimaea operculella]|nr:LIM domain-containing protein [Phthorimaea operculella]